MYARKHAWREPPETSAEPRSWRSSGSGCTSGRPPRDVEDPAGPVAQARASGPASAPSLLGHRARDHDPAHQRGQGRARRRGAPPSRRARGRQPRRVITAPAAAHRRVRSLLPAAGAVGRRGERRARRAVRASRPRSPPTRRRAPRPARSPRSRARRPASRPRAAPTGPSALRLLHGRAQGPEGQDQRRRLDRLPVPRGPATTTTFSYAFCRTEQFPGEKLIPDPRTVVAASRRLPRYARYIATLYCVAMENLARRARQAPEGALAHARSAGEA